MNCYDLSIYTQKRHLCLLNSFLDIVKRDEIDNDSATYWFFNVKNGRIGALFAIVLRNVNIY